LPNVLQLLPTAGQPLPAVIYPPGHLFQ
jgi:hypothetical protein